MKLTKKKLIIAIGDCQSLFGQIAAAAGDRNPNRAADIERLTSKGFEFCLMIRNKEDIVSGSLIDKGEF